MFPETWFDGPGSCFCSSNPIPLDSWFEIMDQVLWFHVFVAGPFSCIVGLHCAFIDWFIHARTSFHSCSDRIEWKSWLKYWSFQSIFLSFCSDGFRLFFVWNPWFHESIVGGNNCFVWPVGGLSPFHTISHLLWPTREHGFWREHCFIRPRHSFRLYLGYNSIDTISWKINGWRRMLVSFLPSTSEFI